jgi:RNA polymerase subunit RPABC4/transcription elongation factor Spt4
MAHRNEDSNAERACQHCGGLVFADTRQCPQCGHFPVKLHWCQHCGTVAGEGEDACPKCRRMFEPGGDYL